ncbi:hypothetical protein HYW87_03605 [Candidatus Roizmanbacteria bacterium]|nr:hypothetical protein [Candidatus Roizmanbacteria bacterium]
MNTQEESENSSALEKISEEKLLAELARRLRSSPAVNPTTVASLESLTSELRDRVNQQLSSVPAPADTVSPQELTKKNWVEIIRQQGKGFLHGKILPDWLDESKHTQPQKSKDDLPNIFPGAFNMSVDMQNGQGAWSHRDFASAGRRPHSAFYFFLLLPEPKGSEFSQAVRQSPDLLEEVFQGVYPGLTERGLQRLQTDKIVHILAPDTIRDRSAAYKFMRRDFPKVLVKPWSYSRVVGEQPK